ncbi:MAG TPA: transcriptional regulator [Hydrogenophaga sp.]|jgi:XRE family aerobic/anaerobic benzoate catabolism transcriptional regulator|uniref:helix-turn-helix transcriptional regulator n=1 Tax=Hydrogenophaga sp. TaxID=1904254 RepID=UPI000ABCC16A|nr:helix-turn-helix transcriptional regulator [Hydrogenophaga sp.]MBU4181650.1 helix-turn-helix transcriptional regulator [Gammaproteobacteria bacterium]MBW8468484.1 helix-turn-helix transcriptional regulator [Thiobacillus sp.]PKO74705.1 MAG: transcriptional regulator [Betaproteobacteria bacterium HGW-Betaproteobacteria-15]MBU4279417.1 helix-turn-helix transcriptional regulator [Gammaproteobacteria bacterium]MBU4321987.1 helix-turn-helix transcriptional regulator [Gammaproteobacteria bacterium
MKEPATLDLAPEATPPSAEADEPPRHPFLVALGERVRTLRSRRGMTRKAVALAADVSERHLANLEYGTGNASILVLLQVAQALQCSLTELLGDVTTSSPEWLLIRELLEKRNEADLRRVRMAIGGLLDGYAAPVNDAGRQARIALIGLRGAGKSTLGQRLADDLGYAFIELSREIEKFAGCSINEIHALYGTPAYRRYERRALEEAIQIYPEVVIATPGGLVSDAANFNLLLTHCTTVWLQADAADHMGRVAAQGDMRPMAASREAMEDLKRILAGRSAFYSKADLHFNTSGQSVDDAFDALRTQVREVLGIL